MWEDYLIKEWDMSVPINRRIRPILRQTLSNVWESIPVDKSYEIDDPELFEMYMEEMYKLLKEEYEDLLSKNQIMPSKTSPTNKPINFNQWVRPVTMYSKTKLPKVLKSMSTIYLENEGLVESSSKTHGKQKLTRIDKISKSWSDIIKIKNNKGEMLRVTDVYRFKDRLRAAIRKVATQHYGQITQAKREGDPRVSNVIIRETTDGPILRIKVFYRHRDSQEKQFYEITMVEDDGDYVYLMAEGPGLYLTEGTVVSSETKLIYLIEEAAGKDIQRNIRASRSIRDTDEEGRKTAEEEIKEIEAANPGYLYINQKMHKITDLQEKARKQGIPYDELLRNMGRIAKMKKKKFFPWVDKVMSDGRERTASQIKDGMFDLLQRRRDNAPTYRESRSARATAIPNTRLISAYLKTAKDESGNKKYLVTSRNYPWKFKLNDNIAKAVKIFPVAKKMINDLIDDQQWKSGDTFKMVDYIDKFMDYLPDDLTPQQMREIKYFYKRPSFTGWFKRYLSNTMKTRGLIPPSSVIRGGETAYIIKSTTRKRNRILQKRAIEELVHEMEEGTEYNWESILENVKERMRELATKANMRHSLLAHYLKSVLPGNLKQSLSRTSVASGWATEFINYSDGQKRKMLAKKDFNLRPFNYEKGVYESVGEIF